MPNIYVLLTRSQSLLSRMIHRFTGDSFTHVSLALDGQLQTLCSFARRYSHTPLPAGLVHEDLYNGYFDHHRYIPCRLYALQIDEQKYENVSHSVQRMMEQSAAYRYDIHGLIRCRLGMESNREKHFFCSMFVASVLYNAGALDLPKTPSLMRPQDFTGLAELSCIYEGRLSGLMHDRSFILNAI